jgi:cytochrome c oxidase subunit 3
VSEKPHAPADGGGHGHDAHGHHGSVFIQHHYDDAQHQFDSGKLAIWLFLAQEVLFFSALFVAYVLYRHHHPEIYQYAHMYLDTKMGAINTAVLIFSSLTAAWAVRAAQLRQTKLLIACLSLTIACALGFLVIKYIEYSHKIHEHILFGRYFDPCVSSGNRPLLTKNNRCPGHESSVVWNAGTARADAGCFPDYAIDQDTASEGVQASCTVSETKVTLDRQGNVTNETPGRAITEQCPEWRPSSQPQLPTKYPCWRPGYQPEVCHVSYSFTWVEGDAIKFTGPFASEDECAKEQKKKATEIAALGSTAAPTTCLRSNAVGIIVEYGDHTPRPRDLRIKATCTGPKPTPPSTADPFADTEQTLELAKPTATGAIHRDSKQDRHEREYAGPPPEHTNMFFTIYFAMTGLHGIHVLFGVFVFIWLLIRAIKGHFTPDYFGPVDFAALYWHIVDLIWIFLFPLLYLIH